MVSMFFRSIRLILSSEGIASFPASLLK